MTPTTLTLSHRQNLGVGLATGKGLQHPVDVVGNGDRVYILNRSCAWKDQAPRITVTSYDEGVFAEIGRYGSGEGCLTTPSGLALGPDRRLYVTDEHLCAVVRFDLDGTPQGRWGTGGDQPGQLDRPSGVACDQDGTLWVADTGNHRILGFDLAGRHQRTVGGPGQLHLPWGVAAAPDGTVWVADWGNHRVQAFSPAGRLRAQLGAGTLRHPAAVAVDQTGLVYVSDWGHHCVRVFDPAGALLATVTGAGTLSRWATDYLATYPLVAESYQAAGAAGTLAPLARLHRPSGLWLDPSGRLLIADTGRHRVQVYQAAAP